MKTLIALVLAALFCSTTAFAESNAKKKQQIRKDADQVLSKLYAAQPGTKEAIQKRAGYAVFMNRGVKILVAGSGKGAGIAVNNKTKKEVFMKMLQIQGGLGMGVKKFSMVFIFDKEEALNKFINSGWEFGGQSTAAAKGKEGGGSLQGAKLIAPGVWVYQMTDAGIALDLTATGTKYYKDDSLNR